jgi:CBS domain-containing protein
VLSPSDGERSLWGVVSDTDLLRHAKRVDELTAADVASRDVVEAFSDEPLEDVATRMARRAVTHALVIDRACGRPVGILSTLDIARVLAWGRA